MSRVQTFRSVVPVALAHSRRLRLWLLLTLTALLRAPSFFRPLMDIDEGCYAAIAARMLDGGLPYRNGVENKVPGVYYVYYWVFSLFGRYNMVALHVVMALIAFLTALVCGKLARRLVSGGDDAERDRVELRAALLYTVFSTCFYPKMLAANTEMLLVLPSALALLAYLRARHRPSRLLAAGALTAVAVLFKQVAVLLLLGLVADCCVVAVQQGRASVRRALGGGLLLVAGFAAVLGLAAAWLASRGILGDAIFWSITYIFRYYLPAGAQQHGFAFHFVTAFLPFALVVSPLVLPALAGRFDARSSAIWLWLSSSLAGAFVGGRMYGHYFATTIPPLCVLAAVGAERWFAQPSRWPRRRLLTLASAAVALVFAVYATLYEASTESFWSPRPDYRPLTRYIAETTRPDERIFVWGWFPAIYVLSDRAPSTRFVTAHILAGGGAGAGRGHRVEEGWTLLMDDLLRDPPPLIADTSTGDYGFSYAQLDRYPPLRDFVRDHYREETTIAGVRLFRRR